MLDEKGIHDELLSIASRKNIIGYEELMDAFGIKSIRELEDVLIQALYEDVIQGRLNPKLRQIEIRDWKSLKVDDHNLHFLTEKLSNCIKHTHEFVELLQAEVQRSNEILVEDGEHENKVKEEYEKIKKGLITTGKYGKDFIQNQSDHPKGTQKSENKKKSALRLKRPGN